MFMNTVSILCYSHLSEGDLPDWTCDLAGVGLMTGYGGTVRTEVQCGESSLLPWEVVMKVTGTERTGLASAPSRPVAAWPSKSRIVFPLS